MSKTNKALSISLRARLTPHSPIRKLVPLADAAKNKGIKIYHLNIGQPDIKSPPRFLKALKTYQEKVVTYENSLGNPRLRQALAAYYKKNRIQVAEKNIIITTGGSEAIIFALLSFCDPSDECLIFEPFYANYLGFAEMLNVKLKPVRTIPENGFHFPKESLITKAITKKTKAIIITNPNNPTGTVYTKEELNLITKIAHRYKLFIISDETYREFVYDGLNHQSFLTLGETPRHVILVDSLSKRFSLCGARLGCLVSYNQEIIDSVTKFAQARLASPSIEQYAAVEALKTKTSYFRKINQEYQKRRDVLIRGLLAIPGVFVRKPEGAFYLITRLPVKDAEAFSRWLLTDFCDCRETVMLSPAAGFYLTPGLGKNEVRLAYVLNSKHLTRAVEILRQALAVYTKKS